ncbi:hypothetical protein FRC12_017849 [Ceratobasidium sp. 428]|nr:hypothetical protein FRC12_017849 [Ceratobasidium sp. 428]
MVVMQRQIPKRPTRFPTFFPGEGDELWSVIEAACAYSPLDRPSSIEIQYRVRYVRKRDRQTAFEQSIASSSTSTAANDPDEHEGDFTYDEYGEYDEYDESTGFNDYVEPLSDDGGSLPPSIQARNMQGTPVPAKLPFPPETTRRARLVVESLSREIEETRGEQYPRYDIPETQRVQMYGVVADAHPLALEFERTASLHYMVFNNQQDTKQLLGQAALLREQNRILQSGQQTYIMTIDDALLVYTNLSLAVDAVKAAYAQRVKQHRT